MREIPEVQRLSFGQRAALAGAVSMAIGLAAYGAVGSYTTVSALAARMGVPLPELVPIGIDGGLVGVVMLDLVLAWTGSPLGWLRQFARLLTMGTVAANVSAGWPEPIAIGLHAAAPLMLLVMVEAGRAVLLRRVGLAAGTVREGVPFGRWVLSPWSTWLLWRRMVLWRVTNYGRALEMEVRRRRACTLLRIRYGRSWRRTAPTDVVWMLRSGSFVEEACVRVELLVGHHDGRLCSSNMGASLVSHGRNDGPPKSAAERGEAAVVERDEAKDGQFEEVVRMNERHWAQRGRPVSAETVRKYLKVGAARARELTSAVRAVDRIAIERGFAGAVD